MLAPLAASLVQPVISSVVNGIGGKGVRRAGKGYMEKKFLVSFHPLSNIEISKYFSYEPRFNGVFSRNDLPRIKDGSSVINLDDKKVKEHTGFHYLLTEIQLYTLILLELNILLKKY